VVADQVGCPTSAPDLADAILGLVARVREGWRDEYAGIYHAAGVHFRERWTQHGLWSRQANSRPGAAA